MFRLVKVILCLALAGCGDAYFVGDTEVVTRYGVEPWADLPEALYDMQQVTGVSNGVWDTQLILLPAWRAPVPHQACRYIPTTKSIEARISYEAVALDCLPHEFAHKWRHLEGGDDAVSEGNEHNALFRNREKILREAASHTWLMSDIQNR